MRPRTGTRIPLVLALALTTVALVPAASAGYHGAQEPPAASWQRLADALDQANVQQARSAYQDGFAAVADEAPTARDALQEALDAAANQQPGSPDYAYRAQIVEKATLAIAFATVQKAAGDGNVQKAQGYFDVLATKFDGDDQLPEAKEAFPNATTESLPSDVETLEETYRDLILAKVYAETHETPELSAGGHTSGAAKEAGEALGYAYSILPHVRETLGQGTGDTLAAELAELGEFALADRADGVREEAHEILEILATYGLTTVPTEKVDAFERYQQTLDARDFDTAEQVYLDAFAEEAAEYAADADGRVTAAFDAARTAHEQDQAGDLAVQVQILEKTILDIAWKVGFHELAEQEIGEGLEYLAPLAAKFAWLDERPEQALPLGHIAAREKASDEHLDATKAGLADHLTSKVREEIEETFINWDDETTSREKAIEALVYARPATERYERALGEAPTDELFEELEKLYNATTARDRAAAETAAEEVRILLDKVEREGAEASELDTLLSRLEDKIDFVGEEYRGYLEAKAAGDESEAKTELGEAKAFTDGTRRQIRDNEDVLREANATALDELSTTLADLARLLNETAPRDQVLGTVDAAIALLDAFATQQAPTGPAVDVRVGPPEASEGTVVIPVALVGLPQDGFSLQATLTHDPSAFTVDEVEIPVQVGASDTSTAGEIRFNAAGTDVGEGPVTVARITVTPGPNAGQASLELSIETLTDAQGEPLELGNVTGTALDLSNVQGADAPGQPVPGLGLVAALAGLALAGLAARHRRPG